jgi:cytochrome c oxidase cbb3-type subunit 2
MKSDRPYAVGAGFAFVTLAMFVQGCCPCCRRSRARARSPARVRTDLADVKWVRYDSSDYTPLEARGRHRLHPRGLLVLPQSVRAARRRRGDALGAAVGGGRVRLDQPHLLSTRRIGPDLTRVGLKFADDWHYAHHWDPRMVVPESMMPRFQLAVR